MNVVFAVVGAVFAIFSVVIVHEFGHFIVARWMGVRVLRFSIGFGKALWSRTTRKGTEFVIALLPLGGYIRMLGEGDAAPPEDMTQYSYNTKPLYARMLIVLAGPLMNILFAILLFWSVYLSGVVHIRPVIGQVIPGSAAATSGLVAGDYIEKVNGKPTPSWRSVLIGVVNHMGNEVPMTMTVSRPPMTEKRTVHLTLDRLEPDQLLKTIGLVPYHPKYLMTIGRVLPGSPAERGGFVEGDRILAINNKRYDDMTRVVQFIRNNPGQKLHFEILRDQQLYRLTASVGSIQQEGKQVGYLGYLLKRGEWPESMIQKQHYTIFSAWIPAIQRTFSLLSFNATVLGKMIVQKISLRALGGPISIFKTAGQASQQSYQVYCAFLAFFSVALGFINLLPIPGLDGGHFLFQLIELVLGRPVSNRVQSISLQIGIIILLLLIFRATLNDLTRLFSGR